MKFKQAKEIYDGYSNLLKKKMHMSNPEIERMAKYRYNICKACEERDVVLDICRKCGCHLPSKTRSKSSACPLKHWTSIP